jgi:uroporphyrinogen-III synthase
VKVVVTRPEPDASSLADRLTSLGFTPLVCPVMTIEFDTGTQPALDTYQAILVTSANGLRALEQTRNAERLKSTALIAVGSASAKLAQTLGYAKVIEAGGNVQSMAALACDQLQPGKGPLLYVTGTSRAGDLKTDLETHGFKVDQLELYTAKPLSSLPEQIVRHLAAGEDCAVLLYSARTAKIWANLLRQAGLAGTASSMLHLCISHAVADQLRSSLQGPLTIEVVNLPGDDAMLAALEKRKSQVRSDTPPENPM